MNQRKPYPIGKKNIQISIEHSEEDNYVQSKSKHRDTTVVDSYEFSELEIGLQNQPQLPAKLRTQKIEIGKILGGGNSKDDKKERTIKLNELSMIQESV